MENPIYIHPDICNGRPAMAGTRILVQTIIEFLGSVYSVTDIVNLCTDVNKHKVQNPDVISLLMIEVQNEEYLGDDDIIRFPAEN